MMKKILALVAALILAAAFSVTAMADGEVFKMGIDPEYDPFSYIGDDGNYTGFDVDVCAAACELAGLKLEIVPVDWDFKLQMLDAKDVDCIWSGMTILDTMKDAGYVLSAPYYESAQLLVVRADSDISASTDLAGKTVAVQLGTSGDTLLSEDLKDWSDTFADISRLSSFNLCFKELEGNAADAVFVDQPVAEKYVSTHPELKILDEKLGAEEYGICFRNGDDELCKKIEDAVAELVASGKYAEIAQKYAEGYPDLIDNLLFLKTAE